MIKEIIISGIKISIHLNDLPSGVYVLLTANRKKYKVIKL